MTRLRQKRFLLISFIFLSVASSYLAIYNEPSKFFTTICIFILFFTPFQFLLFLRLKVRVYYDTEKKNSKNFTEFLKKNEDDQENALVNESENDENIGGEEEIKMRVKLREDYYSLTWCSF